MERSARPADRRMLEQAIMVLDRNRELAERRPTELGQRLSEAFRLNLLACEFCRTGSLSAPTAPFTTGQLTFCGVRVHIPVLQQQAARARLPGAETGRPRDPARTGAVPPPRRRHPGPVHRRAATGPQAPPRAPVRPALRAGCGKPARLADPPAGNRHPPRAPRARAATTPPAAAAPAQQTGPLHVKVCHNCFDDHLAEATSRGEGDGVVDCNVRIDMARTEADARAWNLPLVRITALMLVHEQEHCIQHPNRSQTPAVESEQRLARKLGDARLYQFATH